MIKKSKKFTENKIFYSVYMDFLFSVIMKTFICAGAFFLRRVTGYIVAKEKLQSDQFGEIMALATQDKKFKGVTIFHWFISGLINFMALDSAYNVRIREYFIIVFDLAQEQKIKGFYKKEAKKK